MELQLKTYHVELATPDFLIHGEFQPRGDIIIFLNDTRNYFYHLDNVHIRPLLPNYVTPGIKQPSFNVSRNQIVYMAVQDPEEKKDIQLLVTKRPVVFYTGSVVIDGNFHVNADARDNDLLDGSKEFMAVTDAKIYPLRKLANSPYREVGFVAINTRLITANHVHAQTD